jgi:polysaccharide export outer membrane protein
MSCESATQVEYRLRLSDLVRKGDASANVMLMPGDTIIIPESRF